MGERSVDCCQVLVLLLNWATVDQTFHRPCTSGFPSVKWESWVKHLLGILSDLPLCVFIAFFFRLNVGDIGKNLAKWVVCRMPSFNGSRSTHTHMLWTMFTLSHSFLQEIEVVSCSFYVTVRWHWLYKFWYIDFLISLAFHFKLMQVGMKADYICHISSCIYSWFGGTTVRQEKCRIFFCPSETVLRELWGRTYTMLL